MTHDMSATNGLQHQLAQRRHSRGRSKPLDVQFGDLFILYILALLFEGVLRKWILNSIESPLLFIRDPIVLWIYCKYLAKFGFGRAWTIYYVVFFVFLAVLSLLQTLYWDWPMLIPMLGIRYYVFFIPMAFIARDVLTTPQLRRIFRFLLIASIPTALLVLLQFLSPTDSWINKGTADAGINVFYVIEGVVRPYGPFTFVSAQNNFAGMMAAIALISFERRREFGFSLPFLFVSAFAVFVQGALSGGRTYFGYLILILLAYVLAGLTSPKPSTGIYRVGGAGLAALAFAFVFIVVFPSSFDAMSQRQADAMASEGATTGRVLGALGEVLNPLSTAPILGFGVGAGTNAAAAYLGRPSFWLSENEWPRMINELGPVIGMLILSFRVLLTVWLGWTALNANRMYNQASGMIMFGYCSFLLFAGQITLQNQLLAMCWFAVGLTLALSRPPARRDP